MRKPPPAPRRATAPPCGLTGSASTDSFRSPGWSWVRPLWCSASRPDARDGAIPPSRAHGPVAAAVVLGTVDALTNWAGVVLMVLGLLSMFAW